MTLDQVIEALAEELITTPEEIRHDYPQLEQVYTKARRDADRYAAQVHALKAHR